MRPNPFKPSELSEIAEGWRLVHDDPDYRKYDGVEARHVKANDAESGVEVLLGKSVLAQFTFGRALVYLGIGKVRIHLVDGRTDLEPFDVLSEMIDRATSRR